MQNCLIPFDEILFSKLKAVPDAFQLSGRFLHGIITGFLQEVPRGRWSRDAVHSSGKTQILRLQDRGTVSTAA